MNQENSQSWSVGCSDSRQKLECRGGRATTECGCQKWFGGSARSIFLLSLSLQNLLLRECTNTYVVVQWQHVLSQAGGKMVVLLTHVLSQEKTRKSPDLGRATSVQLQSYSVTHQAFWLCVLCPVSCHFVRCDQMISDNGEQSNFQLEAKIRSLRRNKLASQIQLLNKWTAPQTLPQSQVQQILESRNARFPAHLDSKIQLVADSLSRCLLLVHLSCIVIVPSTIGRATSNSRSLRSLQYE